VKIENAFAQLKNGWWILQDLAFTIPYAAKVILASLVLCNFCKINEEDTCAFDEPLDLEDFNILHTHRVWDSDVQSRATSVRIREALFQAWRSGVIEKIATCGYLNFMYKHILNLWQFTLFIQSIPLWSPQSLGTPSNHSISMAWRRKLHKCCQVVTFSVSANAKSCP
jgi:hypothetical protein